MVLDCQTEFPERKTIKQSKGSYKEFKVIHRGHGHTEGHGLPGIRDSDALRALSASEALCAGVNPKDAVTDPRPASMGKRKITRYEKLCVLWNSYCTW